MSKTLLIFALLSIFATNLFADDQKTIEVNQFLYAPVEIKMSYRDATDFCSNLTVNSEKGWRLAESYADLRPIWRTEKDKTNWTLKDVSFSYKPNEPHFFYCMKDSTKEAKIKTVGKTKHYVQPQALQQKSATEESQKNWLEEKSKMDERFKRVIKESNEYQESLKRNPTAEAKSVTQTEKRFFKNSNLPDCTDQKLTYCYARLKIDSGSFEGELGDGTFEGNGVIVKNNGGAVIGNFKNNELISGADIYTNAHDFFRLRDEAIDKGLTENERWKYIFYNFKGKFYLGEFKNNKREGKGMYMDTVNPSGQNGTWKNGQFIAGNTSEVGQNNSNQTDFHLLAQSQCDGYGFQRGTNPYAQCVMQLDQLNRQQQIYEQQRAQRHWKCSLEKMNAAFTNYSPFFGEQFNRVEQIYNNCMAGLPPPRSGKIDCSISGNNVYCQER
jgi:hypothetical protein